MAMNKNSISSKLRFWLHLLLFVGVIIIVYFLMPQTSHQNRVYEIGKPWQYGLLTAPSNFPIYKTDNEIKEEKDSVMRQYVPYFQIQTFVIDSQLNLLDNTNFGFPNESVYHQLLADRLNDIYSKGLLNNANADIIRKAHASTIYIIGKNNIATIVGINKLFTIDSAYHYLISANKWFANDTLPQKKYLNALLHPNLFYDKAKSEQAKKDLLSQVSDKTGMVQAGERIIDRGEIVTPQTYKILKSYERSVTTNSYTSKERLYMGLGLLIAVAVLFMLMFMYLYFFCYKIFKISKNVIYLLLMQLFMLLMASLTIRFTNLSIYLIPFCILPIIVQTFFDSRTALFTHIITVLVAALMVSMPFNFILMQITAGMVAVASLKQLTRRSQLVHTSVYVFFAYSLVYFALSLIANGDIYQLKWVNFGYFAVNALLLLFAYGLIYIFEKLFGFLSDISLVELATLSTPLMMEFAEKAPGSFQHVMQVSNLAVEAAKKINANMLLVRTGALYHDIGKMMNPTMFTENQLGGVNPLLTMSYEDAAQVVIKHVPDGVKLAQKHGLPRPIIDFITQHHGKSKTLYFYNSYRNAYPDKPIDESKFTYPGPNPTTKESAIVMMADAVEASSRSMKEYTVESINNQVEKIINYQVSQGFFNDAPITFKQVGIVKEVFKEKLQNIYHTRISYPELNKQNVSEKK